MLSSSYLQTTLPETEDYSPSPHLWMGKVEQNKIADQKCLLFKKGILQEKGNQTNQLMTKNYNTGQGPLQRSWKNMSH